MGNTPCSSPGSINSSICRYALASSPVQLRRAHPSNSTYHRPSLSRTDKRANLARHRLHNILHRLRHQHPRRPDSSHHRHRVPTPLPQQHSRLAPEPLPKYLPSPLRPLDPQVSCFFRPRQYSLTRIHPVRAKCHGYLTSLARSNPLTTTFRYARLA